jgi:hypothetical protein
MGSPREHCFNVFAKREIALVNNIGTLVCQDKGRIRMCGSLWVYHHWQGGILNLNLLQSILGKVAILRCYYGYWFTYIADLLHKPDNRCSSLEEGQKAG